MLERHQPLEHKEQTILLIEDETANRNAVKRVLRRDGIRFLEAGNGHEGLEIIAAEPVDLILLDLGMPVMDGYGFLERFRHHSDNNVIPVCVMTAWSDNLNRKKAVELGADDFISKPVDTTELQTRTKSLLRIGCYQQRLRDVNDHLESKVKQRTLHLQETLTKLEEAWQENTLAYRETMMRLAMAAEYKDRCTAAHLHRMSNYSALLARKCGWNDEDADMLLEAAKLHDIGKIGIPDAILMKKGKLTEEEYSVIKGHSEIGANILSNSKSKLLQLAEEVAMTHHERFDGTGYPNGLKGKSIPEAGRVVAIADVFDALMTKRPYKEAWPIEKVVEVMIEGAGSHFDLELLDIFLNDPGELEEIHNRFLNDECSTVSENFICNVQSSE